MASDPSAPALATEQFVELLGLVKDSKTVELKLTVPAESHRATVEALSIDPLDGQMRLVTFFDTPDLTLNKAGVVVRARRLQGGKADSVVKLRPVVPSGIAPELRALPSFGVEVDAMPGGFVCSASYKGESDAGTVKLASLGRGPVRRVFSKDQRAFYDAHAPAGLGLDDLVPLGPVFVVKVPFIPEELAHKLVAELWLFPDGGRILELSTKCTPTDLPQVLGSVHDYLVSAGVDRRGDQETKTRHALQYFTEHLATHAAPEAEARRSSEA